MQFKAVDRKVLFLLPPSINDWLSSNHQARFVVEVFQQIDVSIVEEAFSSKRRSPYPARILLGMLFYGYMTGLFFSHKFEKAKHEENVNHQKTRKNKQVKSRKTLSLKLVD